MMIVFARRQSRLMRGKREERKYYRSISLTNAVKPSSAFLHRGMLTELTELDAPPIEFDEKLWHAVVERLTVMSDNRLVYSLKDGSEITFSISDLFSIKSVQ